jgi:hypothetical protein
MRKGFRSDAQNALNEFHFSKVNNQPRHDGDRFSAAETFLYETVMTLGISLPSYRLTGFDTRT